MNPALSRMNEHGTMRASTPFSMARSRFAALALTLSPVVITACTTTVPPEGDGESIGRSKGALTAAQCDYFQSNGKVKICHATGSAKTPYSLLSVSEQSCVDAHADHARDYVSLDGTCKGGTCLPETAPCDATLPCCDGLSCQSGFCKPVDRCRGVVCNPSDECHLSYCDGATGACVQEAKVDDFPCDDGNACTAVDVCRAGACVGLQPKSCGASDACHAPGTCNPATGACSEPIAADGTPCNDGDACSQRDECQAGTCVGRDPVVCAASDQCHVAGTCNPATGVCSDPTAPNGTACDDHDACSRIDACFEGACVGLEPVRCQALDQCHVAGTCNPANGACDDPVAPDGSFCDDGNACTQTDACVAGACMGASPVTCSASDQCHVAGSCNPATGACSDPAAPDGTACNDTNACTSNDSCQAGSCISGAPVSCQPVDECHAGGTCDASSGSCSAGAKLADGTKCSAGLCSNGKCDPLFAGLAGYWPLDVDGRDISGNGLDLNVVGAASFSPGLMNGALTLHGNGADYLVRPQSDSSLDFGDAGGHLFDFTVQAWVKFNQVNTEQTFVEKFTGGGGPGWTFTKLTTSGPAQFYASTFAVNGAPVTAAVWHHVVARRQGTTFRLWYDGVFVGGTLAGANPPSALPLLVGRRNQQDGRVFPVDGQIDELAIWKRALSDAELGALYNARAGRPLLVP